MRGRAPLLREDYEAADAMWTFCRGLFWFVLLSAAIVAAIMAGLAYGAAKDDCSAIERCSNPNLDTFAAAMGAFRVGNIPELLSYLTPQAALIEYESVLPQGGVWVGRAPVGPRSIPAYFATFSSYVQLVSIAPSPDYIFDCGVTSIGTAVLIEELGACLTDTSIKMPEPFPNSHFIRGTFAANGSISLIEIWPDNTPLLQFQYTSCPPPPPA